ncbi:MAG: choice-of-anchor D domain-containing protein [Bacteroidota bacterium]
MYGNQQNFIKRLFSLCVAYVGTTLLVVAQNPSPRINSISINGRQINSSSTILELDNLDDGFFISVNATNTGTGTAPSTHNWFTLSFPALGDRSDDDRVSEVTGQTSGGLNLNEYSSGSVIAGQTVSYLFIEAVDGNGWLGNESNTMTLKVLPKAYGAFDIYYRLQMGNGDSFNSNDLFLDPTSSNVQDASNQPVYRIRVQIERPSVPAISFSPDGYDFGTREVGGTPLSFTFQVKNTGTANLQVIPSLEGRDEDEFDIVGGRSAMLSPDDIEYIEVKYEPRSAGSHEAELCVDHNATNQSDPLCVDLSGIGTSPSNPSPRINSISIDGQQMNSSSTSLVLDNLEDGFSISVNATNTGTATAPSTHNWFTFSFPELSGNSDDNRISEVTGQTDSDLDLIEYSSGSVIAGQTVSYLFVEAVDTDGWARNESNTMTLKVLPRTYGTFDVYYRVQLGNGNSSSDNDLFKDPSSSDVQDASNQPVYRLRIEVERPSAPAISFSPDGYDFGTRDIGGTPLSFTFQVKNTGTAQLQVVPSLDGKDIDEFDIVGGRSAILPPGEIEYVEVEYDPTNAGSHEAELCIDHNATNQSAPLCVDLTGIGQVFDRHAIIITVDGIAGFKSVIADLSQVTRETNYMEDAIRQLGIENIEIVPYVWNGDFSTTDEEVPKLKTLIEEQYLKALRNDVKLFIIAHSWGTFLTYASLLESESSINPDLVIFLSSPMGTEYVRNRLPLFPFSEVTFLAEESVRIVVNTWFGRLDLGKVSDDQLADRIMNYWAYGDIISGPIKDLNPYIIDYDVKSGSLIRNIGSTVAVHQATALGGNSTLSSDLRDMVKRELVSEINSDPVLAPFPELTITSPLPDTLILGNTYELALSAVNRGGQASYGSLVASFPNIMNSDSASVSSVVSIRESGTSAGKINYFTRGDQRLNHRSDASFSPEYLTVENGFFQWDTNEEFEITLQIKPADLDSFIVDIRANMGLIEEARYTNSPTISSTYDQQGWPVVRTKSLVMQSVSTEEEENEIRAFSLLQNYPNPFNPVTQITYQLPEASEVQLFVFDVVGRKVAELVNGRVEVGEHTINFDASNLSSGIYIYRLQAGKVVQTRRMTLIK